MKLLKQSFLILFVIIALVPTKAVAGFGGFGGFGGGGGTQGGDSGDLRTVWVASFMLMTSQFTATMEQQVAVIGSFFDAKHQLETQRLFQEKTAEAHKDYQPSVQMCEIGTFVRNLSKTDERIKITRNAVQNASFGRELGTGGVTTMDDQGSGSDQLSRRNEYIQKYCNITDNTNQNELLCVVSKAAAQQNADINYTQTIDFPLTLNAVFDDGDTTPEEENIFAFLDQIFMSDPFTSVSRDQTMLHDFVRPYQEMRSLVAMRSVAQNSFAHIIGEKSSGVETEGDITPFIRALLRDMGMNEDIRNDYIGENPSYHAQMEILTKKMLQHPEFMSNLYDKPTNVKRIRSALSAIKLMQDRDIHNAMQRREMLVSMILELQLRHKQNSLSNEIEGIIATLPEAPDTRGSGAAPVNNGQTF